MNLTDIARTVSSEGGERWPLTDTREILQAGFREIERQVVGGESVTVHGFGKFYCHHAARRKYRNPRTGRKIMLPARIRVKFRQTTPR